jgi:nucleoid-associated protein YgaU
MRTEVKAGLVIGLIMVVGVAFYVFNRGAGSQQADHIPWEPKAADDASASRVPAAPPATPAPSDRTVAARPKAPGPRERGQAAPRPTERPTRTITQRPATTTPDSPAARPEPTPAPGPSVLTPVSAAPAAPPAVAPSAAPTEQPEPAVTSIGPDLPEVLAPSSGEPSLPEPVPPTVTAPGAQPAESPPAVRPEATPGITLPPPAPVTRLHSPLAPDPARPTATTRYTIERGDTLSSIARAHYGDDRLWTRISAANPGIDPQRLKVGETITIPPREPAAATPTTSAVQPAAAPAPGTAGPTYVVEHGDTLISIARNILGSGARGREIYELNRDRIADPNIVKVGVELRMPPVQRGTGTPRP